MRWVEPTLPRDDHCALDRAWPEWKLGPEPIVPHRVVERIVDRRHAIVPATDLERVAQVVVLALDHVGPRQVVERAALGHRHQPCAGSLGNAGARPLLVGDDQRILGELLGSSHVVHEPHEPRDQASRLVAPDLRDRAVSIPLGAHPAHMTRRSFRRAQRKRFSTPRVEGVMLDRRLPSILPMLLASACASLGAPLEEAPDEPEAAWPSEAQPLVPYSEPQSSEPRLQRAEPESRTVPGQRSLVAGGFHACVLDHGRVACWGLGDFGQLGDGANRDRDRAVTVAGLDDVVQLSLGLEHSCARLASGRLRCWGANPFGQLGDGTDVGSNTPRTVVEIDDAIDLQLGDFEACAARHDGDIACWGGNLGGMPIAMQPDTAWRARPRVEQRHRGTARLAVTQSYRCLFGEAGVDCWGDPAFDGCQGDGRRDGARCPVGEMLDVVDLDLDTGFGCAVLGDGAVRCWGTNSYGQTPTGGHACYLGYPEPGCPRALAGVSEAVAVAVGSWHACALRSDGRVTCWGTNNFGQIGAPLAETEALRWRDGVAPTLVEPWADVVEIAAGRGFTCARMRAGDVDCIGDMAEGRRPQPLVARHPL